MKLYELQLPKNSWELITTHHEKGEVGDELVQLVQTAYANTPQGSFVNAIKDVIPSDWHVVDWDNEPDIDVTVFYRKARGGETWRGSKIQGIGHDGQRTSKDKAISQLERLLHQEGWWIEASDAMQHILTKINVPVVQDEQMLKQLFNDPNLEMISNTVYRRALSNNQFIEESVFGKPILS